MREDTDRPEWKGVIAISVGLLAQVFLIEPLGFVISAALLFFYIWMRWTLPRYRYDQLMAFGWKWLLPLAVLNILGTAAAVIYFNL